MRHLPHITLSLPGGVQIVVPDDLTLMTPFVLREQGDWFEDEIRFVRIFLRPGMAVVDVGANYGCYTLTAAVAVGDQGRVWSYEPASLPGGCLAESLRPHPQVILRLLALSDHAGTARLGVSSQAELNSLSQVGGEGEDVPLSTIDAEMAGWDRPVDFIKLDAEGEEVRILAGARKFFARGDHPLIMFELKHGGQVNDGLLQAVQALGLKLFRLVPGLLVLEPCDTCLPLDSYQLNLFGADAVCVERLAERGLLINTLLPVPDVSPQVHWDTLVGWGVRNPGIARLWPRGKPITLDTDIGGTYLAGMAHAVSAELTGLPPALRYAHLQQACVNLSAAFHHRPSIARAMSLMRILFNTGARGRAVELLGSSHGSIPPTMDEAFFPPLPEQDAGCALVGSPSQVIHQLIRDALLLRVGWSWFFIGEALTPLLQEAQATGTACPALVHRLRVLGVKS